MKASQSGPTFSHLFFADDLILFAKADWVNCAAIRDVLDTFCSISAQTMSEAKSRVYFSPNLDRDTRESLCDILGFASTPYLGKYLGFPLKHPGSSSHDYDFILDRVKQKLSEGRLTFYLWLAVKCSFSHHWLLSPRTLCNALTFREGY